MKAVSVICLGILFIPVLCLGADKIEIKSEADRINYSIGYQIGGDFQRQKMELKADIMTQGIHDAMNNNKPLMPQEQMNATLKNVKKKLMADQTAMAKKADAAFLAENARKEGVKSLPSGIQYKVIKDGSGRKPVPDDNVTIKYRVTRVEGQNIPADFSDSEPKTYPLKKTLPGLQQVLPLMKEGSIWQIVLPPGPALGGRGETLERAGVLIYDLELISAQNQ